MKLVHRIVAEVDLYVGLENLLHFFTEKKLKILFEI